MFTAIVLLFVLTLVILAATLIWFYMANVKLKNEILELEALVASLHSYSSNEEHNSSAIIPDINISDYNKSAEELKKKLQELDTVYQEQMQVALGNADKQLQQIISQGKGEQEKTIVSLAKQTQEWQEAAEGDIKFRLNNFLENFEANMSQFFINAEQKSLESINLELKSARNLIDTYKAQQLAIVEENIIVILERTLSIVLNEKLNLRDQVDLVYEALEKAKKEKFLG
jgi:F0F1-type ATP synthase membrane subunit b/b'